MKKLDKYIIDEILMKKYGKVSFDYKLDYLQDLNKTELCFELLYVPSIDYLINNGVVDWNEKIEAMYSLVFNSYDMIDCAHHFIDYYLVKNVCFMVFVLENNKVLIIRDLDSEEIYSEEDARLYNKHIFHKLLKFDTRAEMIEFLFFKELLKLQL